MRNVSEILKDAADTCKLNRVRYSDDNTPTSMSNVCIFPFFGDIRSTVVLSSLILQRYKEEIKNSKYFILCSCPGYEDIFPYVDEYWTIKGETVRTLMSRATGFDNKSEAHAINVRNLTRFFSSDSMITKEDIAEYYSQGITQKFFDSFKHIKCYKPNLPSSVVLGNDFNRLLNEKHGHKVFIEPSIFAYKWKYAFSDPISISKDFWIELTNKLLEAGFVPVIHQTSYTYDLSPEFVDKCIYLTNEKVINILSAMRASGCVLDIFSNISRLAILARCPFLSCDQRTRYAGLKEYEIDDLCASDLPKGYIFSFPTIIEGDDKKVWNSSLIDGIIQKLNEFLPNLDRSNWPSTNQYNKVVPYSQVRKKKSKRLGARFIKIPR